MRRPRTSRRLRAYAIVLVLALAALLVAGWAALPFLIERRLLAELKAAGIADAALNVAAVGLHETRIEDVRLGSGGDITAGEIVAYYDLAHLLQTRPQRLVVRDLRASARFDSGGLSFDTLDIAIEDRRGGTLDDAILRAAPPVAVESGRVELATPVGLVAMPFQGTVQRREDGSLAAAFDLQLASEHANLRGALQMAATPGRVDGELMIADGASEARLKLVVTGSDAAPRFHATGSASATVGAWLWPALGLPQPQQGRIRVDVRFAGPLPEGGIEGVVSGAVDDLVVPDIGAIGSGRLELAGSMSGDRDAVSGRMRVVGDISDLSIGSLTAPESDISFDAAIAMADDRLSVHLAGDGSAAVRQLSGAPLAGKLKDVVIPLVAGPEPLLAIALTDAATPRAAYDLRLGAIKVKTPLLGGAKPLPVALAVSGTRWRGSWSGAEGHRGAVELTDGSLSFPSFGVAAQGVHIEAATAPGGWSADLAVARIVHSAKPPLIVPLSLAGTAQVVGDRLSFAGALSDKTKRLRPAIEIEHAFAAGTGAATLKMSPIVFAPGGLQPRDVAPALGAHVDEATGEAAIDGTVAWSAGKVVSDLALLLRELSFKTRQAGIARLNSVVKIRSLVPFATQPGQQLAAGMVDVGLPLTDLLGTFRIDPGPRLVVDHARLRLAGGEVSMGEAAIDLSDPRTDLTLKVRDVDLARLLRLAEIEGLAGTGSLSGEIPVAIAGDTLVIRDAALAATGPGTLSYAPSATPSALLGGGENVDLALKALRNFQYNALNISLNRETSGDVVALMQVKGRNPDFYGGHPVEFNLNVSGKLDQILDRGLAGYRIPENIRRNLEDFGR